MKSEINDRGTEGHGKKALSTMLFKADPNYYLTLPNSSKGWHYKRGFP